MDLTVPASVVTVMNLSPALFGTTASECTGGPPANRNGPAGRPAWLALADLLDDLLEVSAELPAMPVAVPTTAQSTPIVAVRMKRFDFISTSLDCGQLESGQLRSRALPTESEACVSWN